MRATTPELGPLLAYPAPSLLPDNTPLVGRFVTLRRLQRSDKEPLYNSIGTTESYWDFIPRGPYPTLESFGSLMSDLLDDAESHHYAIVSNGDSNGGSKAVTHAGDIQGVIGMWKSKVKDRVTEFGPVFYAPTLQRSRAATEVIYLLLAHAFNVLGYRRIEWKAHSMNVASRKAAERYGFTYEGTMRQHAIVKGRNRDSPFYSMLDGEWKDDFIEEAYVSWLKDENFDEDGKQRKGLEETRELLALGKVKKG